MADDQPEGNGSKRDLARQLGGPPTTRGVYDAHRQCVTKSNLNLWQAVLATGYLHVRVQWS